jgi:hypothetical protein
LSLRFQSSGAGRLSQDARAIGVYELQGGTRRFRATTLAIAFFFFFVFSPPSFPRDPAPLVTGPSDCGWVIHAILTRVTREKNRISLKYVSARRNMPRHLVHHWLHSPINSGCAYRFLFFSFWKEKIYFKIIFFALIFYFYGAISFSINFSFFLVYIFPLSLSLSLSLSIYIFIYLFIYYF